jgi:lysozyme family protein
VVKHSTPVRRVAEVVVRTVSRPATVAPAAESTSTPTPKPSPKPAQHPRGKPKKAIQHDLAVPIVDVVPLRVDAHGGLGAIASNVRDNTRLALAAAALLAAVAAAISGAGLAAAARRAT